MFLLRTIFWLSVVVLLLPADEPNKTSPEDVAAPPAVSAVEAIEAARYTVHDLTGFCDRNPDVCRTGGKALEQFKEKAKHGARLIYKWAADGDVQPSAAEGGSLDHNAHMRLREPAGAMKTGEADSGIVTGSTSASDGRGRTTRDTLTSDDLVPTWGGPAARTPA